VAIIAAEYTQLEALDGAGKAVAVLTGKITPNLADGWEFR
jgi:hypothetical protein